MCGVRLLECVLHCDVLRFTQVGVANSITCAFGGPFARSAVAPMEDLYSVSGVAVSFPFKPYPCQLEYMEKVIRSLQTVSHLVTCVASLSKVGVA